jgi:ADP-ribose pyrophosphatase
MKKLFILTFFFSQAAFGNQSLENYLSYMEQIAKPNGDHREGEIEIVIDPIKIAEIQKVQENRLLQKGFSKVDAVEFSRTGIVYEDQYWLFLRDAVYFPKKVPGTYNRLIWKSELKNDSPGVAVLPVLPSGHIVLNLNYRHATRSWELELPRGMIRQGETSEQSALREVKEETGLIASSLVFLGNIAPDTGVLSSVIPVFIGKITAQEASNPDYSEAIAGTIALKKEELIQGFIKGFIEVSVQGKKKELPLRDSFLSFALFQAELRKLL